MMILRCGSEYVTEIISNGAKKNKIEIAHLEICVMCYVRTGCEVSFQSLSIQRDPLEATYRGMLLPLRRI